MQRLACALLLILLVPTARSEGAPITFDFTVDFTAGPLTGQSVQGTFSVDGDDCPDGNCDGVFDPNGPLNLVSFDITINGFAFDMAKDFRFPDFPSVSFSTGDVVGIDYASSASFDPRLVISGVALTFLKDSGDSFGSIADVDQRAVPEPATLTLLASGLAVTALRRRRGAESRTPAAVSGTDRRRR